MPDKKSKGKKRFSKGTKRKTKYERVSPALCLVVHDLGGMGINDKIADEISDAVAEKAEKYGYVVNITRE